MKASLKELLAKLTGQFVSEEWHNLTLASGFTARGTNAYRKTGNIVEVIVSFSTTTAHTSYTPVTTTALPVGYRPSQALKIPTQGNTAVITTVEINGSGQIQCYNNTTTGAWFVGRAIYIVGG